MRDQLQEQLAITEEEKYLSDMNNGESYPVSKQVRSFQQGPSIRKFCQHAMFRVTCAMLKPKNLRQFLAGQATPQLPFTD